MMHENRLLGGIEFLRNFPRQNCGIWEGGCLRLFLLLFSTKPAYALLSFLGKHNYVAAVAAAATQFLPVPSLSPCCYYYYGCENNYAHCSSNTD